MHSNDGLTSSRRHRFNSCTVYAVKFQLRGSCRGASVSTAQQCPMSEQSSTAPKIGSDARAEPWAMLGVLQESRRNRGKTPAQQHLRDRCEKLKRNGLAGSRVSAGRRQEQLQVRSSSPLQPRRYL